MERWTKDEIDMLQVHDHMIVNYIYKITRKWEQKQGIKISSFSDLCKEGKQEIEDWYRNYPTDRESIQRILARNNNG